MKNYLIGFSLLLLAVYLYIEQAKEQQRAAEAAREAAAEALVDGNQTSASVISPPKIIPVERNVTKTSDSSENYAATSAVVVSPQEEKTYEGLASDSSSYVFTNFDGAIRAVRLAKGSRLNKDYEMAFPKNAEAPFALFFEDEDGRTLTISGFERSAYEIDEATGHLSNMVTFVNRSGSVEIRREYVREANETYIVRHKTTVKNLGASTLKLDRMRVGLGAALPIRRLYNPFDYSETYLNVGYYNSGTPQAVGCSCAKCSGRIDGEAEEFFQSGEMGETGKMERRLTAAKWACVNNQFFASIVRPVREREALVRGQVLKFSQDTNSSETLTGVTGSLSVPFGSLGPGESRSVEFIHYAGPKDFVGLTKLEHEQDKVMQFGIFWWVSEPLNWFLNILHGWLGNFGLAIVVMTIVVKLILWPLTAQATRSQKRMSALQEPMGKLREKYKDDSQKLNQEMMKFYKEQGVNPFAGCWPILIQMPIFLGMFWMLRSAAELYGQNFLWITDLSEQDNVSEWGNYSFNLLPLLMVATQWLQMKLTPMQLGPSATDAQRINAKMMRMMPFMFLIFLYFFSSALVLYWTVQNVMTIFQTLVTKKGKSPEEIAAEKKDLKEVEEKAKPRKPDADFIDDEERKHRQTLGLKMKGEVKKKQIDEIYRERMAKYHPDKLRNLGAKRQTEAVQKKERLEAAHDFMLKKLSKRS